MYWDLSIELVDYPIHSHAHHYIHPGFEHRLHSVMVTLDCGIGVLTYVRDISGVE